MRVIIVCLFALASLPSFSQIAFEKGSFVDNDGIVTECWIKYVEWYNNPSTFEYKLSESGAIQTADISNIREFRVSGAAKYVKYKVKIDRSSSDSDKLTNNRNPTWLDEVLLLKVLVEGKANLYMYQQDNLVRFFFNTGDSVKQLVYKKFTWEDPNARTNYVKVKANNTFRQQILLEVNCGSTKAVDVEKINYKQRDIQRYFQEYNACSGSAFNVYHAVQKPRKNIRLKISSGAMVFNVPVTSTFPADDVDLHGVALRIGMEAEFILPYNKNKWGFIVEPAYHSLNADGNTAAFRNVDFTYSYLEIPIGIRHYFFLNDKTKLFANASIALPFSSMVTESHLQYENGEELEIRPKSSYVAGAGLQWRKLSVEARYYTNQNLLNNYAFWRARFNRVSLVVGYRLF
ncbi:MAG: hypothetical protein ACOYXT_13420 [Bacteroidota bacterium]